MILLLAIILNMKVKGIRKETLSIKEYLNMIRPYLIEVINDQRKSYKLVKKVTNLWKKSQKVTN